MRVVVLVNSAAGEGAAAAVPDVQAIEQALKAAGVDAEVRMVAGLHLHKQAEAASHSRVDAVVAAGGDGTVSAVASALVNSRMPLGILPVGTLNHFARDLGLPMTLQGAAQVIAAGKARPVDVGEVNGRCFVNNSSIGLYPHIVSDRDAQRQRLGRGKWVAMLFAIIAVFRRYPLVSVSMDTGERTYSRTTPFVFVGNNCYDMSLLSLGARDRLDEAELSVYFTHRTGRFALLRLMVRGLFGQLDQARDFEAMTVSQIRIDAGKRELSVACDGEVLRLRPPLYYTIQPAALNVLVPDGDV